MICFTFEQLFKAHYIKPEAHLKYAPLLMKVKTVYKEVTRTKT